MRACLSKASFTVGATLVALALFAGRAAAAPGDLDAGFSADGVAELDFGEGSTTTNPVVGASGEPIGFQPDGSIIVAGSTGYVQSYYGYLGGTAFERLSAARIRPDGSRDPGFAGDGTLETDLGLGSTIEFGDGAVDASGRFLLSGSASQKLFVARFTADGGLDPSFGAAGVTTLPAPSGFFAGGELGIQSSGKIIVGGENHPGSAPNDTLNLYRLTADGDPDPGFGTGGRVVAGTRPTAELGSIEIDTQDRIVVSESTYTFTSSSHEYAVATRYHPGGAPDASFGDGGEARVETSPFVGGPPRAALDASDRAYVALATVAHGDSLLRLDGGGDPDPAFGIGGFQSIGQPARSIGLAVLPGGETALASAAGPIVRLERRAADGSPDPGFTGQPWRTDARCLDMIVPSSIVDPSGRVVVAGGTPSSVFDVYEDEPRVLVARYLTGPGSAGAVDPDPVGEPCRPCEDNVLHDCPPYRLSLSIAGGRHVVAGQLGSVHFPCTSELTIAIRKVRKGNDPRIASGAPSGFEGSHAGAYSTYLIKIPRRRHGRIYAVARYESTDVATSCVPATSPTIRFRRKP